MADSVYAKQIYVNYQGTPPWNSALNFFFWVFFSATSVVFGYLFSMFILDTTIKADQAAVNPGFHVGNPNNYNNIVETNIKPIPLLGPALYP